jgi:hypothetical protein
MSGEEKIYSYKNGGYTIGASQTQSFFFWWGEGVDTTHLYFDVSINPLPTAVPMTPLVVLEKSVTFDAANSVVIIITLKNDNAFPINFIANHILMA